MTTKKVVSVGAVILVAAIAGIMVMSSKGKERDNIPTPSVQATDAVFPVKAALVHKGDLVDWINSSGYAYPLTENEIKPNVSGQVIGVGVYDGKPVRKGDTLLTLDDRELLIAFQEAKNQLIGAQVDYNLANKAAVDTAGEYKYETQRDSLRSAYHAAEQQLKTGEISQTIVDRLKRNYDAISVFTSVNRQDVIADKIGLDRAESDYESAKLKLSYATVEAPFNGVSADCSVQPGSYVQAGQTCMRVINISRIRINCEVTETDLPKIRVGDEAKAQFVAFAGKTFEGRVMQVNPVIDLQKRTATVTAEIDNPSGTIKPGMYATVSVASNLDHDVVIVPKQAVLFRDNRPLVFTVVNNVSQWIYVTLGKKNDSFYEIKDGLSSDDTLVVDGNYNLAHEAKVNITEMTVY